MNPKSWGWCAYFQNQFETLAAEGESAGRVLYAGRGLYRVWTSLGEIDAELSGSLRHVAGSAGELPAVGDWVVLRDRLIRAVVPRRSRFSRKVAGETTEEQVIAANIDVAFLVSALDHDFNLRRLERYLLLAWDSGARPVIILNKSDLCADPEAAACDVAGIAPGVRIITASAATGSGVQEISSCMRPGETAVLLGSSGVGKSTFVNRLLGREHQRTLEVRASDDRGRHATTHREMFLLPEGWLLIDVPGLRELQLWGGDESLDSVFHDVAALAVECRFRDCRHEGEPGCAVLSAIEEGRLDATRLESHHKLRRELDHLAVKVDKLAALRQKQRWKIIHKAHRNIDKRR